MKTKLLFTKQRTNTLYTLLVFCLCFNYGWSQTNLVQNGDCDLFSVTSADVDANPSWTRNDTDNADAFDMTPNNSVIFDAEAMSTGATSSSPFQAVWDNDALEDWLEVFYLGAAGTLDEQPGSTSGGNNGTRGVKLYMDTSPNLPGQSSRRIYQKVDGLTIGLEYTFSVDIRAEATGTPSEIYMLNTEITDETGINTNGGSDASVDGFLNVLDDSGDWDTHTFNFTATSNFVVIYIRSLNSVDGATEVFYDNFSLIETPTASTDDFLASNVKVYPNPARDFITIESNTVQLSSVSVFDVLGKNVLTQNKLTNNRIDVSSLVSGIYFVKINSEDATTTRKIIIE